jgi:hypothetical protein
MVKQSSYGKICGIITSEVCRCQSFSLIHLAQLVQWLKLQVSIIYMTSFTPFSEEAFQQYNLLIQELHEISLSHDKDLWTYI